MNAAKPEIRGLQAAVARRPGAAAVRPGRPKRGLKASDALRRWSDPADYASMLEVKERKWPGQDGESGFLLPMPVEQMDEYSKLRDRIEAVFMEKLINAEVLASGIEHSTREVIDPSLWELLEINYDDFQDAGGSGRKYQAVEFFDKTAIPLNIRYIPRWLDDEIAAEGHSYFRHDPGYRHVFLGGVDFVLGELQANVVAILHRAALDGDPWQVGKQVLARAGSVQSKMADVFKSRKDWETLIVSDGRGSYRLRLEPPSAQES